MNDGGRQSFDARDDDVHLCVLGKLHRFRQFDFAPLDDCFIRQNLHRAQLTTGSASVATPGGQWRRGVARRHCPMLQCYEQLVSPMYATSYQSPLHQ